MTFWLMIAAGLIVGLGMFSLVVWGIRSSERDHERSDPANGYVVFLSILVAGAVICLIPDWFNNPRSVRNIASMAVFLALVAVLAIYFIRGKVALPNKRARTAAAALALIVAAISVTTFAFGVATNSGPDKDASISPISEFGKAAYTQSGRPVHGVDVGDCIDMQGQSMLPKPCDDEAAKYRISKIADWPSSCSADSDKIFESKSDPIVSYCLDFNWSMPNSCYYPSGNEGNSFGACTGNGERLKAQGFLRATEGTCSAKQSHIRYDNRGFVICLAQLAGEAPTS